MLLLIEMKGSHMLRLPYRAGEKIPPQVAAMLPETHAPGVLAIAGPLEKRKRGRSGT
ncbi:MAG: hypothetical protein ACLP9L_27665 [Thermoguttaceae bacterium]